MKKSILFFLASMLLVLMSSTVFAVNFSDLTSEHWAYEPIIEMANKGILRGYPDGTFLPNKSITRAEFAKILVLSLNLKDDTIKNNVFDDVDSSHWSFDYVRIASNYLSGYTNGSRIYFMPDEQAVREDMAVAIVMATNLQNKQYNLNTLDRFSDKDSISESFRKYVAIAVENNLMRGNADGTFNPKGKLTRAEVSQLMLNTTKELEKIAIADNESITLSLNKKSGSVLDKEDVLRFTSENYNGDFHCLVSIEEDGGWHGSYQKDLHEEDKIKVSDFMDYYSKYEGINLSGKRIKITIYSKKYGEYTNVAKIEVEYDIKADEESTEYNNEKTVSNSWLIDNNRVTYWLFKESGSTLKSDDIIKFEADNYKYSLPIMCDISGGEGDILYHKVLSTKDEIRIKDVIDVYKDSGRDIHGEQIVITIYSQQFGEYSNNLRMNAIYQLEK